MFLIRDLGIQEYGKVFNEMKNFTIHRKPDTTDEIWLLEHFPVYTQGQAGKAEHIIAPLDIPVVQSDRGGQITYHGPGQLVVYFLLDCQKNHLGIKQLVTGIEQLTLELLSQFAIPAHTICKAPGVYVDNKKIASLGLRLKNNSSYHGLAINVNMDLSPFKNINPCGFAKMPMTQISDYFPDIDIKAIKSAFTSTIYNYVFDNKLFKELSCSISSN